MASDDLGTALIVSYDARIDKLEKAWKKAQEGSTATFRNLDRRSKASAQQLEANMTRAASATERINASLARFGGGAFTSLAGGAMLAIAPMLSLGAAISGARAALDELGDIADKSNAAGIDPAMLQTVARAAKGVGVEFDITADALATFAKNAGLAATGQGKLYSQLKTLDPALLAAIQRATSQEQRIRLAADAINSTTDAAKRAALASALFGNAGVKLAAGFEGGSAALAALGDKLRQTGQIYDSELVRRSDELGDQLDDLTHKVDVQLKTAFVNLGPPILAVTGWIGDWIADLNIVLDQFKAIESRAAINPLQNNLVAIENERATLLQDIAGLQDQLKTLDPASGMAGTITGEINEKAARAEELMQQALRYQERIAQLQGKPADNLTAPKQAPLSPVLTPERGAGDNSREAGRREAGGLRDGASIDQIATSLGHVTKAAHDSTVALASTDRAVDKLGDRLQEYENLAQGFAGDLISGFEAGRGAVETLSDAFANLGDQLLRMAANQAIKSIFAALGGGPIAAGAGIAGGALGFAGGGYTGAGGRNDVAGVVHRGEVVWSQDDVARHGGAAVVDAMRKLPRFADGGAVGGLPSGSGINLGQTINVAPSISVSVEGGSRGAEADAALAKTIGQEIDNRIRGILSSEIAIQSRPGNLLNSRSR